MDNKTIYTENNSEKIPVFESVLSEEERFALVPPSERVLLISHCLRNSRVCKAISEDNGLKCASCDPDCQVNVIKDKANALSYKGICIAPGGSMALKFIKDFAPKAIAAVACMKELEEGINSVKKIPGIKDNEAPPIVVAPLTKEGCINTEVDLEIVIEKISLGCSEFK